MNLTRLYTIKSSLHHLTDVRVYSLLILLFFNQLTIGQSFDLKISKITDEKGEDPGATFAIVEDMTGFIWFGTVDGLYRYDGHNYKVYRNEKNNPNSLTWNTIRALTVSKDNKLWIGTQGGGLDCLDLETETFTHYQSTGEKAGEISGNVIWSVMADSNDNIWIGVLNNGVDMLDRKSNTFKHYKVLPEDDKDINNITIRSLYEDRKGIIWAGLISYGLSSIDPKTGNITNYRHHADDPNSLGSNEIYQITEDSKGQLIICAYTNGLNIFDPIKQSFKQYATNINNIPRMGSDLPLSCIEKRPGEYWVATEYGLTIIDINKKTHIHYQHENGTNNSLTDNRLRVVFNDSRDIVWVASEAGVDKIIEKQNFKIFANKHNDKNSFPKGIVRSIFEDDKGNIWFGIIDNGVVKYNPTTYQMTHFTHDPKNPKSLSGYHITSIFQDSEGRIWLGEWDTGLNLYDEKNNSFSLEAGNTGSKIKLCDTRIQFIREVKPDVLWIGTESGINCYDTKSQTITYILHHDDDPNTISGNSVQSNAFVQDKNGNLWIGTWSEGLNKLEFTDSLQNKFKVTHLRYDPTNQDGLNNNNVISLLLDNQTLWIGTFGSGLNRMDLESGKFKHYTSENGLPNNVIYSILKDDDNNLWLSTDKGLSRFNPETEVFQNYNKSDGLQDDHFFWGSSLKTRNGELYYGGINGANSFSPKDIKINSKPPVLVFTNINYYDASKDIKQPISAIKKINLPFDKSYITFEYSALSYADQGQTTYLVRMDGLDEDWHNTGNRRMTTYSNLAPGNYTFRLKAANKDGKWSHEELQMSIVVQPAWYNTWLARAILLFIFVGAFFAFYFIRVSMLTSQTRKLEDLVKHRTIEINKQKEELQTVNDNLIFQKEELSETLNQLKNAQKKLIESEKMASLGILTAGVAHEINNPLNFIQAGIYGIENLIEDLNDGKEIQELNDELMLLLERMKTGVFRAADIVSSLNHFSRHTENIESLTNINTIIDNCLQILNHQIVSRIDVIKNYTTERYTIIANEGKMHQVFINIIGNAVHAVEHSGIIEITTWIEKNNLNISIKDNGSGIKEENQSRIFDPFFTTKEAGEGTGLGLSITYGIIKEFKGEINLKSTEGQGTEVTVILPIIE